MADKTKAELQSELKASQKALAKAEKVIDKAQTEAEEGVSQAQSTIDGLNETISRLRAERNDWRKTAGGKPGMRSSSGIANTATPQASSPVTEIGNESTEARLRSERNAWRKAAGGHSGERGPNGTAPGGSRFGGTNVEARLRAERNAWRLAAGGKPGMRGPVQTTVSEPVAQPEPVHTDEETCEECESIDLNEIFGEKGQPDFGMTLARVIVAVTEVLVSSL